MIHNDKKNRQSENKDFFLRQKIIYSLGDNVKYSPTINKLISLVK